ncbi:MAG: DASS family sodium-coupled anion symporter [Nitrospinota bacterium]|nr:MAG: DASS family sodium-coupled anion symporter [Nitrospinota bacterium]
MLQFSSRRKWFFFALVCAGVLLLLPPPATLSREGMATLAIVLFSVICFVTEPIPLPTVPLLIAVLQVLTGIARPNEVARSFMSDAVFFIMGSLMLAVALVKQNLDKRLALLILRFTGPKVERVVFGVIAVSALVSSVIGGHTVAALMLPVVLSLIRLASDKPDQIRNLTTLLLLSIAYGGNVASLGTPSGGARNAIMIDYLDRLYGVQVSYFQWVKFAYPLALVQIPLLWVVLLRTFPPERRDLSEALRTLQHQVQAAGKLHGNDWLAIGIFALTFLLWMTASTTFGLGTIALLGVSLYLVCGLVRWEDLNNNVNWGVVLLYAGALSIGIAMRKTGAAQWVAETFVTFLQVPGLSDVPLFFAIGGLTIVMANIMGQGPAVAVLGPILLSMAEISHTSLLAAGFMTAFAASIVKLTVIGAPPCAIVYSSGYLRGGDFLRGGWRMTLLSWGLLLLFRYFYWPLLGLSP